MAALMPSFSVLFVLNCLIIYSTYAVNIQLYEYQNFTGLVWQTNSSADCINIPWNKISYVSSIRTDTCLITYNFPACHPYRSIKYMPGDINETTKIQFGRRVQIESFHICNKEEGGSQLNLDLTKVHGFGPMIFHEPLESYRNVCSCVNVPEHVQKMRKWSIDNHHNDLLAYYEPCCSKDKWNPKLIAAGHYADSRNMQDNHKTDPFTNIKYRIQSFGPNSNSSYFNISCKLSQVANEKITFTLTENTKNVTNKDDGITEQFQILANKVRELQVMIKVGIESILNQQKEDMNKLTQKFADLHKYISQINDNVW